jgi:hypothetical protein
MAITIADNQGNAIDQNNPLPVDLTTSEAIIPTDIQNHLTQSIQTHNAVSVPLSGNSAQGNGSSFAPCDGFKDISITVSNDNNTSTISIAIQWSFDGTNVQGGTSLVSNQPCNAWGNTKTFTINDIQAPYFRVALVNGDATAAHTMSAWAYLKA